MKRTAITSLLACLLLVAGYGCDNPAGPDVENPTNVNECSWQTPPSRLQGTVSYNTVSNAYGSDTLWYQELEISWTDTSVHDDLGYLVNGWSGVGTRSVQAPGQPSSTYYMNCAAVAWTSPYYEGYLYIQAWDDSLLAASVPDSLISQGTVAIACGGESGLSGSFIGVRAQAEICVGTVNINSAN